MKYFLKKLFKITIHSRISSLLEELSEEYDKKPNARVLNLIWACKEFLKEK